MAKFIYREIKHMTPRDGAKYATDYYKQDPKNYDELQTHIRRVITEITDHATATRSLGDLEQPLKGFPRTGGRPNYSALDIMYDMYQQFELGRDLPSGILGRWNRLFAEFPEEAIEMVSEAAVVLAKTQQYRALFA